MPYLPPLCSLEGLKQAIEHLLLHLVWPHVEEHLGTLTGTHQAHGAREVSAFLKVFGVMLLAFAPVAAILALWVTYVLPPPQADRTLPWVTR